MRTISTEELFDRLERGNAAVFDVRGDVEYEEGHIPGSKSAPLGSLGFRVARIMNPDSFVAVYGEGRDSHVATEAAERLEGLGMRNVHCYQDGLSGWKGAGHTVVASVGAKEHTQGPVRESRPIVVDRDTAYGGAFKGEPSDADGGGG